MTSRSVILLQVAFSSRAGMVEVKKEGELLGATVSGLNLTVPLHEKDVATLRQALAEHQVLFFRDQTLSARHHREFGLAFGTLQIHPSYPTVEDYPDIIYLENDRDNPSKIDEWHTDMSFTPIPPMGSILIARIMPEQGGDTMFASLGASYDDLPDSIKKSLSGLTATHSFAHGFKDSLAEPGGRERLRDALDRNPDVVHPVVTTHPVSGRKMLFVNRIFTSRINELHARDSEDLLSFLCDHMVQDKYVYRFKWRKNSIAFWDNRAVLHKPVNDYWPATRRMERVTINDTWRPA
jgi:taurine dioxygenase